MAVPFPASIAWSRVKTFPFTTPPSTMPSPLLNSPVRWFAAAWPPELANECQVASSGLFEIYPILATTILWGHELCQSFPIKKALAPLSCLWNMFCDVYTGHISVGLQNTSQHKVRSPDLLWVWPIIGCLWVQEMTLNSFRSLPSPVEYHRLPFSDLLYFPSTCFLWDVLSNNTIPPFTVRWTTPSWTSLPQMKIIPVS